MVKKLSYENQFLHFSDVIETAGCEIAAYQGPNGRAKWGTGKPKIVWMAK